MKPSPEHELIDDIVTGIYPDPKLIRERYILTQSLLLLVFIAKHKPGKQRDHSAAVMKAAIRKMMEQPDMGD
jgi:hypothetical protein